MQIDLLIAFDTPQSTLKKSLPKQVNIHYIFNKEAYTKQQNLYNTRHKNIINRLKYRLYRFNEKRYCRKILNDMTSLYDIVINFSDHFDSFINFRKNNIAFIRWQHLALKNTSNKEVQREISYLKKYHKVVTICEDMKRDTLVKSKIRSDKIEHIYNPLNFSKIRSSAKEKIDIKVPYLIQVARLDKIKRHSDLIEIYAELRKKGIKQKLYIIGNGDEYNTLSNQIKKLSLEEYCILLGEINNPYPYIKNADIFLHTSEREGLPTVLLESAILETVIVTMDCPTGPREITNNGTCGELINLNNKEDFVEKTYNLISEPLLRQKYINKMNNHLSLFSEEKTKKDFLKLIRNIANRNIDK